MCAQGNAPNCIRTNRHLPCTCVRGLSTPAQMARAGRVPVQRTSQTRTTLALSTARINLKIWSPRARGRAENILESLRELTYVHESTVEPYKALDMTHFPEAIPRKIQISVHSSGDKYAEHVPFPSANSAPGSEVHFHVEKWCEVLQKPPRLTHEMYRLSTPALERIMDIFLKRLPVNPACTPQEARRNKNVLYSSSEDTERDCLMENEEKCFPNERALFSKRGCGCRT